LWIFRFKKLFCVGRERGGGITAFEGLNNSVENIFSRRQCTFNGDVFRCFYTTQPDYYNTSSRRITKRKPVRFRRGFRKEIFFSVLFTFVNSIAIGSTRSYVLHDYYLFACLNERFLFYVIFTYTPYGNTANFIRQRYLRACTYKTAISNIIYIFV